jgi:hypothetical protein
MASNGDGPWTLRSRRGREQYVVLATAALR